MDARKILFVVNAKSGASDNNDIHELINEAMAGFNIQYEHIDLEGEDITTDIRKKIEIYKPETAVAAGGDGTVSLVASLIYGTPVKLGIIPLGSANGLAGELGIPTDVSKAIEFIIQSPSRKMDLVKINGHISLHLSDLGINARIIKEFEKEGKRGFYAYFRHFVKELVQPPKHFRCTVIADGRMFSHISYMTLIANSSRYGTGANINPLGKIDDGRFEVILIRPYRNWIWKSMVSAFTGSFHLQPNVEVYPCTKATIKIKPAQELQVDGEALGMSDSVEATIIEGGLNIIY